MPKDVFDENGVLIMKDGKEIVDQTPVSFPIKFQRPEPIHLRIRRMILEEINKTQRDDEYETFADADDFVVPDDPSSFDSNPTPYEQDFDHLSGTYGAPDIKDTGSNPPDNPPADPSPVEPSAPADGS